MVQDPDPETNDTAPPVAVSRVRASDQERGEVVTALHRAGAEGRLTLDEVDQRTAAASAARFRHELDPLTADLPVTSPAEAATGWPAVWHGVLRQSRATLLGVAPDTASTPSRPQQVLGVIAALAVLVWLALWVLIGFAIGVMG